MSDAEEQQDFAAVLIQHNKGRAHTEASNKLSAAVEAVRETRKAATVTIKVRIAPVKDMDTTVKLDMDVAANIPREPSRSIWYVGEEGSLHRNDPKQTSLFETDTEEVKRYNPEESK